MSTTHVTYFVEYKSLNGRRWLRHRTWAGLDEIYFTLEEAEKVAGFYTNIGNKAQVYKQTITTTKVKCKTSSDQNC